MKFKSIKIRIRKLYRDFERSWSKAAEMQMRIDEAKLRVGHPALFHRSIDGVNKSKNIRG